MPEWVIEILLATVLGITSLIGAVLALVGIPPGIWVAVVMAIGLAAYDTSIMPWSAAIASLVLAGAGEVIELLSGAVGAKKAGASKSGAFVAMLGGIAGAIVGSFVFPIIGTIIGGLLGAWAGGCCGGKGCEVAGLESCEQGWHGSSHRQTAFHYCQGSSCCYRWCDSGYRGPDNLTTASKPHQISIFGAPAHV